MLVSVLIAVTPGVLMEPLLLPALLYAAYKACPNALAVLFGLLVANGIQVLLAVSSHSAWYLWPSAAWFAWYFWIVRHPRSSMIPIFPVA
jgi:hypothetical protein